MRSKIIHLAPGIVVRLRLVFLAVSMVLISSMVVGYLQIKNLGQMTNVLTDASVPVFVQAQEIERSLTGLVLSLRTLDKVQEIDELEPLRQELNDRLEFLRENATQLLYLDSTSEPARKMMSALVKINDGAAQLLDLKRDRIVYEIATRQVEDFLKQSHFGLRNALEELAYDTSVVLSADVAGGAIEQDDREQAYSRNLRQANAVTELSLGIEALINTASRVRQISDDEKVSQIEKELRFRSQTISVVISQLWPGSSRTTLATEMIEVRALIFGESGILKQIGQARALRQRFESLRSGQRNSIRTISGLANGLVISTRARVDDASQHLESNTSKVIYVMIVAGLSSLLVFGFANVLIVEKQINQRMSRLTKAVSAIAADETDYEVDIEGDDELGEMALALETFKSTAQELRRSNTELEKFAYVAAHDLRSPLRAIQDLAEWIVDDENNQLSEEGRECMGLLQRRVDRLNLLLSDLLTYSRVGRESGDLASLTLPKMLESIKEMLDANSQFEIVYSGVTAEVVTYATPLRQILLNLISNGIKHHDKNNGVIKVTAEIQNGRLKISVEDDGPGIEPQYHDRIFGLFQTLRPRDEVEGSGLGLAIIHKLLEHYGGEIQIVSNPKTGRGSKFEFDMPEKSDEILSESRAA